MSEKDETSRQSEIVILPTPRRTEGDGMENSDAATTLSTNDNSSEPLQPNKIVHLIPKNFIKNSALHVHVSKEPKYVPYEPYKAAVNPRMPSLNPKKPKKKNNTGPDIHQPMTTVPVADLSKDIVVPENLAPLQEEMKLLNISDCPDLESEMQRLRSENSELESQVRYQAQVNGELKKLLVAAVGEDIETRVNHLTEDKLHLAQALMTSAQKMNTHQEQMEWLAGQCEVWRSKFLASSLMVEELAKWKAALTQKVCDYQDVTKRILAEHQVTHAAVSKTYTNLAILGNNFDLAVMSSGEESGTHLLPPSCTALDLARGCHALSSSLKQQLLGSSPFPIDTNVPDLTRGEILTPAEKQAYQCVNECLSLAFGKTDVACSAVMGAAGAVSGLTHSLSLYHPPCCVHCQDRKVQTI